MTVREKKEPGPRARLEVNREETPRMGRLKIWCGAADRKGVCRIAA